MFLKITNQPFHIFASLIFEWFIKAIALELSIRIFVQIRPEE